MPVEVLGMNRLFGAAVYLRVPCTIPIPHSDITIYRNVFFWKKKLRKYYQDEGRKVLAFVDHKKKIVTIW